MTFRYPGSERAALEGFDLQIPAGCITAVVGPNGAGKTTLLKLLCRFYDPQTGAIAIDGVDLRLYSLEELRRNITVLFQQPVRYSATARENIALGHLDSSPPLDAIRNAAQAAGAEESILRLRSGYDTLLGKWFEDGAELSTGEWQRLALARAFLRPARLIVLDEPTSSMDPWAEADWLERFRRLAQGRTALIITHRFTTAMLADVIHVMDSGRIVESGSHRELAAREQQISFLDGSRGFAVDVHWRPMPAWFPSTLDPTGVWDSVRTVTIAGYEARILSPPHLMLYLCGHGGKHAWERLAWICGVARLALSEPDMDWDLVFSEGRRTRTSRMLAVGLLVTQELLGQELPREAARFAAGQREAKPAASSVWDSYLDRALIPHRAGDLTGFYMKILERPSQKFRCVFGTMIGPLKAEFRVFKLPPALYFLYYFLRPLRLTYRRARRALGGVR